MHAFRRFFLLPLLAAVFFSLPACDGDDADDLDDLGDFGTSDVNVSEGTDFEGIAYWGEDGTNWGLILANEDGGEQVVTFTGPGTRPTSGAFNDTRIAGYVDGESLYLATSGTLTVSGSDELDGSFSFEATNLLTSATITLSGTFRNAPKLSEWNGGD